MKDKNFERQTYIIEKYKDYIFEGLKLAAKQYQELLNEVGDTEGINDFKDSVEEYEKTKNIEILENHIYEWLEMSEYVDFNTYFPNVPTEIKNAIVESPLSF